MRRDTDEVNIIVRYSVQIRIKLHWYYFSVGLIINYFILFFKRIESTFLVKI